MTCKETQCPPNRNQQLKDPDPEQIPATATAPQPKLTTTQNTLCEIASDLIFAGGETPDVRDFLEALASHKATREFPNMDNAKLANRYYEEWRRELGRSFSEKPVGVDHPDPVYSSISDAVRQNLRYRVGFALNDFLKDANFEELAFIREVLNQREANGCRDDDEIHIARACSIELDRAETNYFAMSENLANSFRAFRVVVDCQIKDR